MRKHLRATALAAVLAIVGAACQSGRSEEPTAAAASEGAATPDQDPGNDAGADRRVLRQALFGADIGTLDPHRAVPGPDRQSVLPVFDGLVRYVPGDALAGFEPDLAVEIPETPDVGTDGTQVWEFELRDGVMCHPGPETEAYELTFEDVVGSYQKAMDPDASSFAGDYANVESVEAVGDDKVAFTLTEPRSEELFLPLVANIGGGYVACMRAVDAMGFEAFSQHPVGTGPFKFESYTPGQDVRLTAFDDYWRGAPRLDGIHFLFMADDSSRALALRAGEVDFIIGTDEGPWVERMDGEEGITAFGLPVGGLTFFEVNQRIEPFDDVRVRRAVMYASNRAAHIALGGEAYGEGFYDPAYAVSNVPGGPGDLTAEQVREDGLDWIVDHDPARARELLAEAGYPDGFSFEVVSSESEIYRNNYQVLQADLAEVGIDMAIEVVDHPTMHSLIREGANAIVQYTAPRPTTDMILHQFLHSDSIIVEGETPITNFASYGGVDDLIDAAQAELDVDRQRELWQQASLQAMEDAVIMPLFHHRYAWAHVDGFDPGHEPVAWMHSAASTINERTGFDSG